MHALLLAVKRKNMLKHGNDMSLAQKIRRPIARFLTRGQLRIFMCHRFSKKCTERSLDVKEFREQINYLHERFTLVPIREVLGERVSNRRIKKPLASVSLDDGYRDFNSLAYPLLRENGIRPTFFVTSRFADEALFLWPDVVRAALVSEESGSFQLGGCWSGEESSRKKYRVLPGTGTDFQHLAQIYDQTHPRARKKD